MRIQYLDSVEPGAGQSLRTCRGGSTEIGWVGNAEFGSEYRDRVGLSVGTDPLDWANRRVALSARRMDGLGHPLRSP